MIMSLFKCECMWEGGCEVMGCGGGVVGYDEKDVE